MSVIGIDFGNLNCVIAQAQRGGVDVILNEASHRQNASYVSIQGKQRFMTDAAFTLSRSNFRQTVFNIKRFLGRKFSDADMQAEIAALPFSCVEVTGGRIGVRFTYNDEELVLSMEQIAAMLLFRLRTIAEAANAGVAVADVVLSIPPWYTDAQRKALLNAAEIAGLNVLSLLHDSTAIALSYGIYKSAKSLFDKDTPTNVAFVDLGHASFTVSVVSFITGQLTVRSTVSDRNLGGRDFDEVIMRWAAQDFKTKTGLDCTGNAKAMLKLQAAAEKAKKTLSPAGVGEAIVTAECLYEDRDYSGRLTREKFEELCAPLLDRLVAPVQNALQQSGLALNEISEIQIVGGGSRVECVKRRLAEVFQLDPTKQNFGLSTTLNADEAVARGTALQCAILSARFRVKEFNVIDAVPFAVKLVWDVPDAATPMDTEKTADDEEEEAVEGSGNSVVIFGHLEPFPKTRRVTFTRRDQFSVTALYDESTLGLLPAGSDPHIATYTVNVPQNHSTIPRIRLNVRHNRSGMVEIASAHLMEELPEPQEKPTDTPAAASESADKVSAEDKPEEKKKKRYRKTDVQVSVSSSTTMTRAEVQHALEQEASMAQQDRIIRETADKRNELESYIYGMRDKLDASLRQFVTDAEKSEMQSLLGSAEQWLYSDEGFDSTKSAYAKKLEELTVKGNPIEKRKWELENRPQATSDLQALLDRCKSFVSSNDPMYSHITDAEKKRVREIVSSTESWYYDQLTAQGGVSENQNPVLTVAGLNDKRKALYDIANPIMTKPKPAPAKEPAKEEAKTEPPNTSTAAPEDSAKEDSSVPMEEDPKADKQTPVEESGSTPMEEA